MKTKLIVAAGALAMLMTGCDLCKTASTEKTSLVTEKDKYSYALGAHFGNQARFQLVTRDSIDLDLDLFIQAFKERYNSDSAKFLMNDSVIMETLNKLSADRQAEKVRKAPLKGRLPASGGLFAHCKASGGLFAHCKLWEQAEGWTFTSF